MEWLRELLDRLTSVFPRILQLTKFEAGVRFSFGKYRKVLGPGWYMYMPLFQRMIWMEVQSQITDLRTQSIRTKDGKDIIVSGAIQYSIDDVDEAICLIQDIDKALSVLALGIILKFVSKRTLVECQDIEALKSEILKGSRSRMKVWGVRVESVEITDIGVSRNIRLLSNPTVTGGYLNAT